MEVSHARTGSDSNSFGKYRFIAGLGRGGMAAVHLAVVHGPSGFNKLVVLKQIHTEYIEDPEILGMFLDEARLAARLSHPNVVQTNEVGHEGEHHFIAMEYLDGQPLSRILRRLHRQGGLPLVLHLQILADLLGGLHYAHELADYDGSPLGVVHRDVTPHNIFVTYDGMVKVVDFGIAKAQDAQTHTRIGIIKGKIAYMAPEQARSDQVDRRADVFSVGVMLWEAATGARPWTGVVELTMLKALLAGQFPTPRSVKPGIPEPLEAIILKAIAHDRRDRYATAAELQAAIEGYLETIGGRLPQRALAKLVSSHFEAERSVIRSLIEEQLRWCNSPPTGAAVPLPVIDLATVADHDSIDPPECAGPRSEPTHHDAGTSAPTPFAAAVPSLRAPPPRRWVRRLAGALLAGVVVVALAFSSKKALPRALATALPEAVVAAAPAKISPTVEIRLSVSPANAQIFLDEELLAKNPFEGALPRDAGAHRIRVQAPGFVPRIETVSFEHDLVLDIVMAAAPVRPGPLPEPDAVVRPSHTQGHQRHLDATNPYKNR